MLQPGLLLMSAGQLRGEQTVCQGLWSLRVLFEQGDGLNELMLMLFFLPRPLPSILYSEPVPMSRAALWFIPTPHSFILKCWHSQPYSSGLGQIWTKRPVLWLIHHTVFSRVLCYRMGALISGWRVAQFPWIPCSLPMFLVLLTVKCWVN